MFLSSELKKGMRRIVITAQPDRLNNERYGIYAADTKNNYKYLFFKLTLSLIFFSQLEITYVFQAPLVLTALEPKVGIQDGKSNIRSRQ